MWGRFRKRKRPLRSIEKEKGKADNSPRAQAAQRKHCRSTNAAPSSFSFVFSPAFPQLLRTGAELNARSKAGTGGNIKIGARRAEAFPPQGERPAIYSFNPFSAFCSSAAISFAALPPLSVRFFKTCSVISCARSASAKRSAC